MVRILGILVVGLIALNIGLGAALLKGRFEAVKSIRALEQEIHTRSSLSGERHDGWGSGRKGPRDFRQVQERLGLTAEQAKGLRQFLRSHRDKRRDFAEHLGKKEKAIRDALLLETVDVEAIVALRREIQDQQRATNNEAFRALVIVLQSLSQEQRAAMLSLSQGRSNSLLFL
jgi:Spy/CpxP family protein refolding chaperone